MSRNRKTVKPKREIQYRAEDLKTLEEQRAELIQEMKDLTETAETEKRALSEDEDKQFEELDKKVQAIDSTISKLKRAKQLKLDRSSGNTPDGNDADDSEAVAKQEERAFEYYIRTQCGNTALELREGEQNLTMGNNGAIIPLTIANRIITKARDICPIMQRVTMYYVKGTLKVPVWGTADGHDITVAYQEEFTDITADAGKFTSIDLSGYLAGVLTLIGISVVNNGAVDVVGFVINEMAKKIAIFLERELLIGTENKATGALSTQTVVEAAASTVITADELIDLQASIKQVYQKDACWIMNPDTYKNVKKLKDGNGRYLLQDDFTGEFPYRMLGKPVFISDNMPKMAAGGKAILYGDLSGLSMNMRENISLQVLLEKYATRHAVGVVGWFEFDSKITEHEKLAVLKMKSA